MTRLERIERILLDYETTLPSLLRDEADSRQGTGSKEAFTRAVADFGMSRATVYRKISEVRAAKARTV